MPPITTAYVGGELVSGSMNPHYAGDETAVVEPGTHDET
jgi:hypothetical protein